MKTYENKEELKAEIKRAYDKYIAEFKDIPESLKDKQCMEVDRTPAENLAYQVGWTALVLKWENDEQAGLPVKTPSDALMVLEFNFFMVSHVLRYSDIKFDN